MVSLERRDGPGELHPDALSLANLLSELAQFPGTALTMEEICDRILEKIMPLFPCEGCWLATPSRVDGKLELRACRGPRPATADDLQYVAIDAIGSGFPPSPAVWAFDRADAPAGFSWPSDTVAKLALSPMRIQDRYVGCTVLLLGADQELTSQRELLLASIASQAGLVIRSVDLLLASQELVLQEERSRIAREIHDGVSQNLALLMLKMEIISRLADSDPPRMKAELQKVMGILESSVYELRRSIYALRSPGLAGLGLLPALRRLARDFSEQTNIEVELSLPASLSLPPEIQSTVFSVIQERLDVVGREGSAGKVSLEVQANDERLLVYLRDDGPLAPSPPTRTDPTVPAWQRRIGERIRPYGGVVLLITEPHQTTVQIALPLR